MSIINHNNNNNGYGVSHKLLTTKESNSISNGCFGNNNNNNNNNSTVDGFLQIHHGCSGVVTETAYPPYKLMMRPFSSSCDGGVVVDSVSSTTVGNNSSNNYTNGGIGAGAAFVRTLQQPFNHLSPGGGGGGMATGLSLGFPFTHAQWKELERQALIYKYMVSSVPVPDYLLFPPLNKAYPDPFPSHYSLNDSLRIRFPSNGDLEPGRCKRTDGKKWRCARDAAPGQKYCERHLHRGRPRSRKHVELVPSDATATAATTNKKTRLVQPATQVPMPVSNLKKCGSGVNSFPGTICSQPYNATPLSFGSLASGSPYKEPRELNWLMMPETTTAEMQDHQWQHMLVSKSGSSNETGSLGHLNSPNFHHQSTDQLLSLNSSKEYSANQMDNYNNCTLFLNSDTSSLDKSNEVASRGLIDAWSNGSSHPKLSLSSLTLSMGGSGIGDSESGPLTAESDRGSRSQTPWVSSSPGGPLAEVLGSSILNQNSCNVSNTSSPRGTNEEPSSSLTATVSSPSRVLQRTLASMSDSSGGSSPTLASSMAKSEITLQWFNPSSN